MTTTCPACQKTVDSLRSRFVGVRDGKVVAYCSAECVAQGAATAGPGHVPARTATPAAGVPARIATPAAGVSTATRATTDVSAGPPRPVTPPPGVPVSLDSGPVIEILREPASAAVTKPASSKATGKSTASGKSTATKSAATAEPSGPRAKHPDEIPIAAFWTADKEKSGGLRAPVELGAAVRPADAAVDGAGTHRARDAPTPRADSEADAAPVRRSRLPLVLLILVLLGAGGYAIYHVTAGARSTQRTELAPPPPAPVAAAPPPAPPAIDPADAVDEARTVLRGATVATTPRVSRLAASALARTGDAAALALLAGQLGLAPPAGSAAAGSAAAGSATGSGSAAGSSGAVVVETSDIAQLDLAYSLARGGDPRGLQFLATALGSRRAELRDEAARLLALLGDRRAIPHLTNVLAVSQRRLGAAEHLAHLAEPRAVKALEQLRADPRASADDKTRATIALGVAGHAEVAPALREMLGDAHFNAFAAAALAALKDPAARPVLERQLDSSVLRVRAARALRRLDPALDARPLLAGLLALARTGRDTDQVQAAEAILLLCGPPAWSTYE